MTRALLAAVLINIIVATNGAEAQQPRDNQRPRESGAASLFGKVVDDHDGHPLRRARVTINGAELTSARTVITADDGSFSFGSLPAGRYTLSATKDAYVGMRFGASAPGRPGRMLSLADGSPRRVTLRLQRGSVITGTVLTPEGDPAPNIIVSAVAWKYDPSLGDRRHTPAGTSTTDDRGIYRIYGLAAGTYFIAAAPISTLIPLLGNVQVMPPTEVRRALVEVRESRTASRPGMPSPAPPPAETRSAATSVSIARVYYPGTSIPQRAAPITLSPGEVRQGINIDLDYVPTATIEGTVTVPAGMRVQLTIADTDGVSVGAITRLTTYAGSDDRFVFRGIPPGTYTILARASLSGSSDMNTPDAELWGEVPITVAGEDLHGLAVPLHRALTISGTIVFDGGSPPPAPPGRFRLPFRVFSTRGNVVAPLEVHLDGWRFTLRGLPPGPLRFGTPARGVRAPVSGWWLKSVLVGGEELLDQKIDIRASADDAVITFGTRTSELSGTVRGSDSAPVGDGFVIVFSTDPRHWFHDSRRLAGGRLTAAGKYSVRNLPPGDYHVAVSNDIQFNEWFDAEALKKLLDGSHRISIRTDEIRVQDLVIPFNERER